MKVIKYLAQILASVIYSNIFTGIMYLIIVLPLAWIISLPWWGMLLVIVLGGGIIEGVISLLQVAGIIPYAWIVKNNIVAQIISIIIIVFNLGRSTYILWKCMLGQGYWAVMVAVVFTIAILQLLYATIFSLLALRKQE